MTHIHTHTHTRARAVGPLWKRDGPFAETSTRKYNNHKRQAFMSPAGCKPATPGSDRPKIHALDRAETGIGRKRTYLPANIAATETASEMEVERKLRQRLLKRTRCEDGINNSPE